MVIRRGEIYLVDLGEPDGSVQAGTRPVLIIQNDTGNTFSPTVIGASISRTLKECNYHVAIGALESGLSDDSMVKLEQIATLPKSRLIKKMGSLSSDKMKEIDDAIKVSLGLK